MAFALAHEREIPSQLGVLVKQQPLPALGFVCLSGALLANFIDIEVIAAMGSGGFLLAFAAVNIASVKLSATIGVARWIPVVGTLMCLTALVVMITQVGQLEVILFAGMVVLAIAIEVIARTQGRGLTVRYAHTPK